MPNLTREQIVARRTQRVWADEMFKAFGLQPATVGERDMMIDILEAATKLALQNLKDARKPELKVVV